MSAGIGSIKLTSGSIKLTCTGQAPVGNSATDQIDRYPLRTHLVTQNRSALSLFYWPVRFGPGRSGFCDSLYGGLDVCSEWCGRLSRDTAVNFRSGHWVLIPGAT